MNPDSFDDVFYDFSPLDMNFLQMSPTEVYNSLIEQPTLFSETRTTSVSPEAPPSKRVKTDLTYPEDLASKLVKIEKPKSRMIIANSFGWDRNKTLWQTVGK